MKYLPGKCEICLAVEYVTDMKKHEAWRDEHARFGNQREGCFRGQGSERKRCGEDSAQKGILI